MDKITVSQIMTWNPCPDYTEGRVRELIGDGLTPEQILDLPIPAEDRIWVMFHEEIIPRRDLGLLACDLAAGVLSFWLAHYPTDARVAECIRVTRRYWLGEATEQERTAAGAAAWAAARRAAAGDAGAAAWAAAGAAGAAASPAAWAATWASAGAVGAAARAAAGASAGAVGAAARAAAGAAGAAARAAARAAAGDAQIEIVRGYLSQKREE